MIYIYDILLNFNDLDKMYDFFEWNTSDEIEHIKKIGLVKIAPKILDDFISHSINIETSFLKKIHQMTEVFSRNKLARIDYSCLFTDGNRVIALEFNKEGDSIYKSKLLLDEEEDIINLSMKLEFTELAYEKSLIKKIRDFLTRKEEMIKRYLTKEIISTYKENDYIKLKFLYEEYSDQTIVDHREMYQILLKSMDQYLDQKHLKIYELLKLSHKRKQM